MKTLNVRSIVLAVLLAANDNWGSGQNRPVDLPSDANVQASDIRAEGTVLANLSDLSPVGEGYFQKFIPNAKNGYVVTSDRYVLGRFAWKGGPRIQNLLEQREGDDASRISDDQKLLDGLVQVMVPDFQQLGLDKYSYSYVGRDFLGSVRCVVYDVAPRNLSSDGFVGRIFIEDKTFNIVRFTGFNPRVDALFAALRDENSKFRIDSWRTNVREDLWIPAFAFVREVPPLGAPNQSVTMGQIRFWGYHKSVSQQAGEFAGLGLQKSPSATDGREQQWQSPQQSFRQFEDQAEANVLARLSEAGFLAEPGDVERKIDQVVTNLVATNKLMLSKPVRCRVLLTTPFEVFSVGSTLIVSRGLVDAAPSESALSLILAHAVAHYALGHPRIDQSLGFEDVLKVPDAELLAKLRFQHTPAEEAEADKKALEILAASPYASAMSDGGLFMQAIQARAKQLQGLVTPQFGEHVADAQHSVINNKMFRGTPLLDEELPGQVAALPLGSKLVMNAWDGHVELYRSNPLVAPAPYERLEFAVTPFMPQLEYAAEKSNFPTQSTPAAQSAAYRSAPAKRNATTTPAKATRRKKTSVSGEKTAVLTTVHQ